MPSPEMPDQQQLPGFVCSPPAWIAPLIWTGPGGGLCGGSHPLTWGGQPCVCCACTEGTSEGTSKGTPADRSERKKPHQGFFLHNNLCQGRKLAISQEKVCIWRRYCVTGTHDCGRGWPQPLYFPCLRRSCLRSLEAPLIQPQGPSAMMRQSIPPVFPPALFACGDLIRGGGAAGEAGWLVPCPRGGSCDQDPHLTSLLCRRSPLPCW